jgi:ectoine hydroxylase-related dioxygenase (phytanoyl-CoA dioxygenase family)
MACILSDDEIQRYERDGLVIVRGLFDTKEIALLRGAMERDPAIRDHVIDRLDGDGRATRIALWNRAGDSVYGLAARCRRVVDTAERLIGGEVYHFQSKLTAKDPQIGGAWEWHQDYGYWYHNGCLFPRMASVMVALDRTTRENGCLQLVRRSHLMGRIDHVPMTSGQNEADPKRMTEILARLDVVYAELEPGDAVWFHCNTLHRSDANRSDKRRWTLLYCYNAVANDTFVRDHDRYYVKLEKVPDSAIREAGLRLAQGDDQEHFASRPFVPDTKTTTRKAS